MKQKSISTKIRQLLTYQKKARPPPGETTLIYMNCLIIWILLTMPMRPSGLFGRASFCTFKKFLKKFQKIFGVFEKRRIAPRKGGKHHQLSNEKGGENVEPNSREFYKQCAFQKFCNTVLHNEACDTHRELRRHKAKEVTFSDMTLDEARQLHTFDEYFKREAAETVFEKAGKKITPKLLLEAIRTLPEEKRKAVLLYYFEGMNDTEIAKLFNTSRSTIQYRRTSSFELLRKYLEENADEWDEW